jgi:hypothetical protein
MRTAAPGPLFAVEAPARCERCLEHDLGAVLVEEDASDELLSRGDAELLVEVLDVVLDAVLLLEQHGPHTSSSHVSRFAART